MKDAGRGAVYEKISPNEAYNIMKNSKNVIVIDVRSEEEYNLGHIENAISIPLSDLNAKVEKIIISKDEIILVYCRSGIRSEAAARELIELGYSYVYDMGGIIEWPYKIVI